MSESQEQVEEAARETWSDVEVRVIGALVEKQITTPDNYPLSMNALKNACNQKSSRDPVMELDTKSIDAAIYILRNKHLLTVVHSAGGHVLKYRHDLPGFFGLEAHEVAVLCVLMLRGPQTPGEIRGRSGRMYSFESVAQVVSTIDELMHRMEPAIIAKLPREAGRKEQRYMHLLCGNGAVPHASPLPNPLHGRGGIAGVGQSEPNNIYPPAVGREELSVTVEQLGSKVASLRQELDELKAEFATFRKQFD